MIRDATNQPQFQIDRTCESNSESQCILLHNLKVDIMHFSPLQACSDKAICVWEMVIHTNISERPLAMAPATSETEEEGAEETDILQLASS
mgnify:CR=1 FL=1